ncbi:hypothetical protein [Pelagicoccus sp. SDUM812003]|uniref:hypothetical protein n=1 Tax=Pelagicoccus sp. SDUM812003 TaxID=3041267 RepID=UPI00280DED0F|nr:hypothetical protein [Pelagicoccus sp. SDUM812003]MDQ8204795.1 hypothetical protein [Pelagicoccus sp. SDUM812003]
MPSFRKTLLSLALASVSSFAQEDPEPVDDLDWLSDLIFAEDEAELGVEEELAELAELEEMIQSMVDWTQEASLAAGFGWKNNVLLEETGGVDAAFLETEFDYLAFKPALGHRLETTIMVYGEIRWFDGIDGLDTENLFLAQASVGRRLGDRWKLSTGMEAVHTVQAYDRSAQEFEIDAARIRFREPGLVVSLERSLMSNGLAGIQTRYSRADYDIPGEAYDTLGSEAFYKLDAGRFGTFKIAASMERENYEQRLSRSARGERLDRALDLDLREWGLQWEHSREQGFWRGGKTQLLFRDESETEGSFYGRGEWSLRQKAVFHFGAWELSVEARLGEVDYDRRPAVLGQDDTRKDDSFRWSFDLSRRLSPKARLFLRGSGDDKDSNANGLSYRGESVMLGVSLFQGL